MRKLSTVSGIARKIWPYEKRVLKEKKIGTLKKLLRKELIKILNRIRTKKGHWHNRSRIIINALLH